MRLTTSRNSTADATMSTSLSVSPDDWQKRMPGAIRQAPASSEPKRGEPRARIERGLLERPHRRMERGGAPEQVVRDPADVVAQLVVVGVREQRVVVRGVDSEKRDDAGDEEVEGGARLPGRRRAGSPRRGGGCLRAGRRRRRPSRAASGPRDGCSARRGRPRRAGRCRPSGSASRSRPARSPLRVPPPDEHEQPGDERRIDHQVDARRRATGTRRRPRRASGSCTCRGRRRRRGTGRR